MVYIPVKQSATPARTVFIARGRTPGAGSLGQGGPWCHALHQRAAPSYRPWLSAALHPVREACTCPLRGLGT